MFLLNDLKLPLRLEEIQYNKEIKNKLLILSKYNDLQCFILYGSKASGKKTFIKCFLNNYYDSIITSKINKFKLSNDHDFIYNSNKYYYEFYPSNYHQDNIIVLKEFINYIKNSMFPVVIVVYNIHNFLTNNNTYIIKQILEKYNNITILGTNNKPLDILLNLRVRNLNKLELCKIGMYINRYGNINYNFIELKKICNKCINLEDLYIYLQEPSFDNYYNVSSIVDILLLNDINMFGMIKNIIKKLIIKDVFSVEKIILNIIKIVYEKTKINYNILTYIANELNLNSPEYKYKHIFIEIFIINIYKLLNN
jgi:hypothetical protein